MTCALSCMCNKHTWYLTNTNALGNRIATLLTKKWHNNCYGSLQGWKRMPCLNILFFNASHFSVHVSVVLCFCQVLAIFIKANAACLILPLICTPCLMHSRLHSYGQIVWELNRIMPGCVDRQMKRWKACQAVNGRLLRRFCVVSVCDDYSHGCSLHTKRVKCEWTVFPGSLSPPL